MTGLYRRVDGVGAGHDVPPAAKLVAAASLFLWAGVMYWGRMLPFIGNAFSTLNRVVVIGKSEMHCNLPHFPIHDYPVTESPRSI